MDADQPRRLTDRAATRRRRAADRLAVAWIVALMVGALFAAAHPTAAAGLLPEGSLPIDVPSPPVEVPSVP